MKERPTSRQVPLFLSRMPPTLTAQQGISIGINASTLSSSAEEFEANNIVSKDDPMCVFLRELQETVDSIRINAEFTSVRKLLLATCAVASFVTSALPSKST
jgi:hypothetical protein